MARKTIQRTFTQTRIKYANVGIEDGTAVVTGEDELIVHGRVSADRALKLLTDEGITGATVLSVETFENKYRISVENFMKHGELVEESNDE